MVSRLVLFGFLRLVLARLIHLFVPFSSIFISQRLSSNFQPLPQNGKLRFKPLTDPKSHDWHSSVLFLSSPSSLFFFLVGGLVPLADQYLQVQAALLSPKGSFGP
jgi:hypothetical protein